MSETEAEGQKPSGFEWDAREEEGGWSVVGIDTWHRSVFEASELVDATTFLGGGAGRVLVVACPDPDVGAAAFATLWERLVERGGAQTEERPLRLLRGFDIHAISRTLRRKRGRLWLIDGIGAHAAAVDEDEVLGRASLWAELRNRQAWTDLLTAADHRCSLVVLLPKPPDLPASDLIKVVKIDPVLPRLRMWFPGKDLVTLEAHLRERYPDPGAAFRRLRQLGNADEVTAELNLPVPQEPAEPSILESVGGLERAVLFCASMLRVGEDAEAPPLRPEVFDRAVTIVVGDDADRVGDRSEARVDRWRADRGGILAKCGLVNRWYQGAEPRDRALRVAFRRPEARDRTAAWLQSRDPTEVRSWTHRLLEAGVLSRRHGELCVATMLHAVAQIQAEPVWTGEPLLMDILSETIPGAWDTVALLLWRLGAEPDTARTVEVVLRALSERTLLARRPSLLALGLNGPYDLLTLVEPLLGDADPEVRGQAQRLVWDLATTPSGFGELGAVLRWLDPPTSPAAEATAREVFVQILEYSVLGAPTGPLQLHLEAGTPPGVVLDKLFDPRVSARAGERASLHLAAVHTWLVPPRVRAELTPGALARIDADLRARLTNHRAWSLAHTLGGLALAELTCRYAPTSPDHWTTELRMRGRLDRASATSVRAFLNALTHATVAASATLAQHRSPGAIAHRDALAARERALNRLGTNLQA